MSKFDVELIYPTRTVKSAVEIRDMITDAIEKAGAGFRPISMIRQNGKILTNGEIENETRD